jgi:hypothetical protein
MRYQSSFDVFGLIAAAKKELAQPAPEQFKVFLLAVMAGLRRRSGGRGAPFELNQQNGSIRRARFSRVMIESRAGRRRAEGSVPDDLRKSRRNE